MSEGTTAVRDRTVGDALRQAQQTFASDVGGALFTALGVVGLIILVVLAFQNPGQFFQILIYGLTDGALYALVALGYTMVYGIIELINFAHGDIFTLGSFVALPLLAVFGVDEGQTFGFQIVIALAVTYLLVMIIIGMVNVTIERIAYRPLRNAPRLAPLITAIGMSFVVEGLMYIWRGPSTLHFPDLLPETGWIINTVRIGVKDIYVLVLAIILVTALTLFINRSKLGKAMRATAQDRDAAQLMGIDINRTIAATFFIGAVLAGAGGMTWGLYFNNVNFALGFNAGLIAFTAAVLGGIGNIQGAALGGLLIGIIAAYSDAYWSPLWTPVVVFGILILILVFRPTGLLGMRVPEK
jgi:branched-chain amino acid transport system permease protein